MDRALCQWNANDKADSHTHESSTSNHCGRLDLWNLQYDWAHRLGF